MKLEKYIKDKFKGNVSAFARSVGTSQTQACRWVAADCDWDDGKVKKTLFDVNAEKKLNQKD